MGCGAEIVLCDPIYTIPRRSQVTMVLTSFLHIRGLYCLLFEIPSWIHSRCFSCCLWSCDIMVQHRQIRRIIWIPPLLPCQTDDGRKELPPCGFPRAVTIGK